MKQSYVYILASQKRGTLYVGVTSDLKKRIQEHKTKTYTGFTEKYDVTLLVWYEVFDSLVSALEAEKKLKRYQRAWKIDLIEKTNPEWRDLSPGE